MHTVFPIFWFSQLCLWTTEIIPKICSVYARWACITQLHEESRAVITSISISSMAKKNIVQLQSVLPPVIYSCWQTTGLKMFPDMGSNHNSFQLFCKTRMSIAFAGQDSLFHLWSRGQASGEKVHPSLLQNPTELLCVKAKQANSHAK